MSEWNMKLDCYIKLRSVSKLSGVNDLLATHLITHAHQKKVNQVTFKK